MIVTALKTFTYAGKRYHRGDTPNLVSAAARELARTGEVSLNGTLPVPLVSRGQARPSSVSPPALPSPPKTLPTSIDGEWPEIAEGKSKKQRMKDADALS